MRPSTVEAACGKNPVYHAGKVYGYLTRELARQIAEEFDCEINLMVTVRNGDPLYDPHSVVVNSSKGLNQHKVAKLIRKSLEERNWTKEILDKQPFLPTSDFDAL